MGECSVSTTDNPQAARSDVMPVVIVLDRLRSAFNVGNIFRLAEITGAAKVIACGYTAAPPHPKLQKTARGCDEVVPCEVVEDSLTAVKQLKEAGYHVAAVETVEKAEMIWDATLPFPLALVFGNEALGIDQETLKICDQYIKLPCYGFKNSLNVGNCAAVTLYQVRRLWQEQNKVN